MGGALGLNEEKPDHTDVMFRDLLDSQALTQAALLSTLTLISKQEV